MKKLFYAAVFAALFAAGCKGSATAPQAGEPVESESVQSYDIAYVKMDSLWLRSDLYLSEGVALQDKLTKAQQSWSKREQNLQWEANQLQEKYQKGLMTSIQAAQKQEELQRKAQNYQTSSQREAATLDEENFVLQNRFADAVQTVISEINAAGKYKLILNSAVILDGDAALDITDEVLQGINAKYAAEKKSAPKGE